MNLKVPKLAALVLLASVPLLHAGFYGIDSIDTPSGAPVLLAKLHVDADTQSQDTFVKAYFLDKTGKIIATNAPASVPLMFTKADPTTVGFLLPPGVSRSDCNVIIVFGDSDQAEALGYPNRNLTEMCDYPEKKLVDDSFGKTIDRKAAIAPFQEYTVNSGSPDIKRPQVTLFLRMPKGVSDPKELKGVMVVCVLWQILDQARADMQKPDMDGDYHGLFTYANEHKLAIIAWGGPGRHWDASRNYDQVDSRAAVNINEELNFVADAWEYALQGLTKKFNLPTRDYLLWGECGSAQWAQRLCLRKPQYFLGTYLLIPGSFDKPTPDGSRVLWCLCTGDHYAGYENALAWHKECQAMGYPMIFKVFEGLGHSIDNPVVLGMAFKFFDFALTQKAFRDDYDSVMTGRISRFQADISGQAQSSWLESFKHPAFYGDVLNQEVFPADQVEMIPETSRTPLPTKELADYWDTGQ